ncbi:MAG: copper homeostasis protein CutC [Hungatella sp.]
MNTYVLEACVDSVESALQAVRGGADRLELCSNLVIGGTTPTPALFQMIRELCDTKIHVLVRPRYGDFLYTEHEFEVICRTVEDFCRLGADGIVTGCLKSDGSLDVERMRHLKELVGSRNLILHRAFDVCRDPMEAINQAIALGIQTILTSGQQETCELGIPLLHDLIECAHDQIDILVGSGVSARNIARLMSETGATCFHMSGKVVLDSPMTYRKQGVSMGIPGMGEYEIFRTEEAEIRKAKTVIEDCLWQSAALLR